MKVRNRKLNHETELNLVPMLDLFLSLIPFLLMSTVLASFGGIVVEAPSYAPSTQAQTEKPKLAESTANLELDIAVQIKNGQVSVLGYKRGFESRVEDVKGEFELKNVEGLRAFLSELHHKYSKIHSSLFHASPETRYEDAVLVLNVIRSTEVSQNLVLAVGAVR